MRVIRYCDDFSRKKAALKKPRKNSVAIAIPRRTGSNHRTGKRLEIRQTRVLTLQIPRTFATRPSLSATLAAGANLDPLESPLSFKETTSFSWTFLGHAACYQRHISIGPHHQLTGSHGQTSQFSFRTFFWTTTNPTFGATALWPTIKD